MTEGKRILYVDDDDINLLIFKRIFGIKYDVLTAESGPEGLKVLEEEEGILAVISDMKMPKMSGLDFIRSARSRFPNLKYYILTAFLIDEELQGAVTEGLIERCFSKPLSFEEIDESLDG